MRSALATLVIFSASACHHLTGDDPSIVLDEHPKVESAPLADGDGDQIVLDSYGQRVFRRDSAGRESWSTTLDGHLGLVRPPHLRVDANRAYVTHGDGVTAVDVSNGTVVWHSPGPADRMHLSSGLLLAADCGSGENLKERWLVARAATTGAEAFRVALPVKDFDPNPVVELVGLFLVQDVDRPGGRGCSMLVDRAGRVRHKFDRYIVTATRRGDGCLFLTGDGVTFASDDGKPGWFVAFGSYQWIAGGDLVPLPGGDQVAFVYCEIANSGVELIRFNPGNGELIWRANCPPLPNVVHSGYSHRAGVVRYDGRLRVESIGSAGRFVEDLDERTGKSLDRTEQR
jgi:outer membrane protein assembly factor BamB